MLKAIIITFLSVLSLQAFAWEAQIESVENCIEREFVSAKTDYKLSMLSSHINFESFLQLRCDSPIRNTMKRAHKELSIVASQKREILDPNCPNCLKFKILWNDNGITKMGVKRNNIFLISKDY